MIRIMLVDDHTLVREALRMLLDQDAAVQVVAEASDGKTALRMAEEFAPDVVVMDIGLPGQSGIALTQQLLAWLPSIKVLALSTFREPTIIKEALDAGCHGYIVKSSAGSELKKGILSVASGRSYLCPQAAELLADHLRQKAVVRQPGNQRLSQRELQVATLLAKGKSAPMIASELHISPRTVDVHRRNLMKKLELHNVVELATYAIRTGLIIP